MALHSCSTELQQRVNYYRTTEQPVNSRVHGHYMNMLPLPQAPGNADLHKPRTSSRKRIQRFFVPFSQIEKYQMELIDTQRLNIKKGNRKTHEPLWALQIKIF